MIVLTSGTAAAETHHVSALRPFATLPVRRVDAADRVAAVEGLGLRGHAADPHLDAVVRTLALACRVPVAVVNIVLPGLQTYPAEVGVGQPCTAVPDALSPCVEVVESGAPVAVTDATTHPRYAGNPLVRSGAVAAYAGHPLVHRGHVIGVLSVFADAPRTWEPAELEILAQQAGLVEALLALRADAAWDPLTGQAGRPLLLDRAGRASARAAVGGHLAGVAVLDVVGMTGINLLHGSAAGDEVLRAVGERLAAAVEPGDSVARLGGDQFGIVLDDLASLEEARARVAELAGAASGTLPVHGHDVAVRLTGGVAASRTATADALLAAAEHDAAARAGLPQEPRAVDGRAEELRRAIEGDELVLHYQPVVSLASGTVEGVEALVRWQHPERGLLPPSEFIPEAEHSGLVVPLGTAVLRRAAAQCAAWHRAGRALTVAVNLSPRQMASQDLDRLVAEVLAETGAPARLLVLEITESSVMDEPSAPETLDRLHRLGVRLALDDFGTGYSSLSYLRRFPVDTIKVDRSFVAGLGRHADDDAIVASVVSLAEKVDKAVVAEGVETEEQAAALRALGVPLAQGFLWSRALPVAELERWLATVRPRPAAPAPREPVAPAPAAPATGVEEHVWRLHQEGASLHTIAAVLNADGHRTPRGTRWGARSVATVVAAWSRGALAPGRPRG